MPVPRHRSACQLVAALAAWAVLCSATTLAADRPVLQIPRVDRPPVLADLLAGATPPGVRVTEFVQREPGDGVPASQPTEAYLSYDSQHLYAVFLCRDDPSKVRANLTRREAIMGDDVAGVIVDTYNDGRRAYLFLVNPLGIQMDGVSTEGQDDDYSYDTLWTSDGRVTRDGYVVVIAIPFKSLRFRSDDVQTWGILLARIVPRANETSFWPYVTKRISSIGQQMATLDGIASVSPGRNLQAIPYGSFAAARFLDEDGARADDTAGRAGVDGKIVVKDTLTVDLTVNPDFSQIESDEPQVTINKRFETFFPEKRPFFIENASYFETPQNLFFSRRIADPDLGVRVTGKSRGWAFGGLWSDDDQPGRQVAPDDPRRDANATVGVVRLERDFRRQSYLGGIFTDKEFGNTSNRVFGADGRWNIDSTWSAIGQVIGSDTVGPSGRRASGSSLFAEVRRDGRSFDYEGNYLSRSPDFRAELGFIPRVDLRETGHEVGYRWYPKTPGRVLSVNGDVEANVLWDYGGRLQEWTIEPGFEIELPRESGLGVRHWNSFERFEGIDFEHQRWGVYGSTAWWRWMSTEVFYAWGTAINYYPADGLRPFLGDLREVEATLTLRPVSQLRLDETYLFTELRAGDGLLLADDLAPAHIFNNHIFRSRANYQFTRPMSARVIVDYQAVLPNESLVALEREKRLALDLLFTYLVNPWTALYVGYRDEYGNVLVDDPRLPPWTLGGPPTTPIGRQVFVKISYLFKY
jgi:hypothetical protein